MPYALGQFAGTLTATTSTSLIAAVAAPVLKRIVKEVWLSNKTGTAATVTMTAGGFSMFTSVSVPANTTVVVGCSSVLAVGEAILGGASTGSAIDTRISYQDQT